MKTKVEILSSFVGKQVCISSSEGAVHISMVNDNPYATFNILDINSELVKASNLRNEIVYFDIRFIASIMEY